MLTARHNRRRSISATVCLLVVVLLHAPLAGAAWFSYHSACCRTDQCPITGHHHQKAPAAPADHMDCSHDVSGMTACSMSCCQDSERSVVSSSTFVLPPAVTVAAPAANQSPFEAAKSLDFLRAIEPLAPPPRLVSAAV